MAAAVLLVTLIAGGSLSFSVITRLPMVAGWDHLLPPWFSRLHPRFRTPTGSIIVIGLAAFAYLVMFAIPLLAAGERPRMGVRIAAILGLQCAAALYFWRAEKRRRMFDPYP